MGQYCSSELTKSETACLVSDTSDASFEELVVIQEKQDAASESVPHLAAREEADRLSALDALAARSGITVAKQVIADFSSKIVD